MKAAPSAPLTVPVEILSWVNRMVGGPGTGQAAPVGKVRLMKQAVGDVPLALASGVTPENVTEYLPWIDCAIVATGISYSLEDLDPARVRDLVWVVRAWRPPSRAS